MKMTVFLCSAVVLTLAGCGSGGGSGTDATVNTNSSRSIIGNATKGPLEGASVSGQFLNASGLSSGGSFSAGATDGSGNFSVSIGAETPPFLRLDTGGGSYVDEADPAPENGRRRIEFDTETGLSVIFPSDNDVFPLNLVTQLLSAKSLEEASAGNFGQVFAANRQAAIEAIGFDVFNVVPADPLNPAADASLQEKQYGMILGALAQALNRAASELGFAAPDRNLLRLFSRDISDGAIDGREFGTVLGFTEGPDLPGDTDINAEIERFRNNNSNAYIGVPLARFDEVRLSQNNGGGNQNLSPVAADDSYSVARGEMLNVAAPGVLTNDADPDDSVFTVEVSSPASAGEVTPNNDGSFSYSHDGSRTANDSFDYRLTDTAGNSDTATVSITVTGILGIPVAVQDSASTEPGLSVDINVVSNDQGPVDSGSIEVVAEPSNGEVAIAGSGVVTYTPDPGFDGGDSFSYRVANSQSDFSEPATVSVSVVPFDPGNQTPQADSSDFDVDEDELADFELTGSDSDGELATFEIVSLPDNGTLFRDAGDSSLNVGDRLAASDNSRQVFYLGEQNFNGGDGFRFRVFDNGGAASQEAVVTINVNAVNDAPFIFTGQLDVIEHDNLSAPSGYDISEALGAGDVDNSIDELTYILDLAPTEGELALDGEPLTEGDSFSQDDLNQGIVEYFHFGDEPTDEFFDVTVIDPDGDSDTGTVFVLISPVNDPPVANDDLFDGALLAPRRLTFSAADDLMPAFDTREGNEQILFQTNRAPSSSGTIFNLGSVTGSADQEGNLDTGPNAGFGLAGAAASWVGVSGQVVVTETVGVAEYLEFDLQQAPFVRSVVDGSDAGHRTLLTLPDDGSGAFMKVSQDGSTAIWRVVTSAGNTQLRVAPYASLTGQSADATGTVVLEVATPVGVDTALTRGTAISRDGGLIVQSEAVDGGFDLFLRSGIDGALIRRLTTVGDSGGEAVEPDFALNDANGSSDRVIAFAQRSGNAVNHDLFVIDIDGNNLQQLTDTPDISERAPSFGPDNPILAYSRLDTPAGGGLLAGEPANINVYIADFFNRTPQPQEGQAFTILALGVLANDIDEDGDVLNASQLNEPVNGSLTLNGDGSFTYTHDGSENFSDQFQYEVSDPDGETSSAFVDLVIEPVNDVPVAVDDSLTTDEDTVLIEDAPENGVLGNDTDGEDDPLSVTAVNGDSTAVGTEITLPSGARLLMSADGTYRYNPIGAFDSLSAGVQGSDSFDYTVSDGEDEATGTVTATIDGINDAPMAADDIYSDGFPGQRITVDPNRDIQPAWDPRSGSELIIFRTGRSPGNPSVNNLGQSSADGSIPEGNLVVGSSALFGISAGEPSFVGTTGLAVLNRAQGAHSYLEVNADTGAQIRNVLTIPGGGGGGWMTVSRDGSTAMWRFSQSGGAGATELRTAPYGSLTGQSANAVGTVVVSINLGSAGEYSEAAALTPDGSAFVLSEPSGAGRDLFLRSSVDGSLLLQLTSSGSVSGVLNRVPDISPDGQTVAFARNVPNGFTDVFTIGIDGSGLNQVTATDDASEYDPSYSPDGLRFAIRRNDTQANGGHDGSVADNNNIYVINSSSTQGAGNGVPEGGTLNAAVPGVLANDVDVDGDILQAVLLSGPANATTFTLNADGSFSYVHNGSETSSDSFTYLARDPSAAESATTTVSIDIAAVNDAPVLTANDFAVDEDNDSDTANGPDLSQFISSVDADNVAAELTYTLEAVPGQGGITRNGTGIGLGGTFTQTQLAAGEIAYEHFGDEPDGNPDSFTLTVRDPGNLGQTATVMVTINAVNDNPELEANDFSVDEGATFTLSANELAASDEESAAADLVYRLDTAPTQGMLFVNGFQLVVPAGGGGGGGQGGGGQGNSQTMITADQFTQADVNNGLLTYVHSGDEPAVESFAVTVRDNGGDPIDSLQASATLAITINPVNDLPELVNNTLVVDEGGGAAPLRNPVGTGALQAIDAESGAADLVFQLDSEPANGLLRRADVVLQAGAGQATFTQADIDAGLLTYEHDGSETTSDSIDLSVTDEGGQGLTLSGTFVITVNPLNDAPIVNQLEELLVGEGATVPLTTDTLSAFDAETTDNSLLVFTAPVSSFGDFLLDGNVSTSFSQQGIEDGLVAFQHDSSSTATSEMFGITLTDNDPVDPRTTSFNFTVRVINSPFVRRSTTSPVGQDADGAEGDAGSDQPTLSGNGQQVLFRSLATNFGADGGDSEQVYNKLADNTLETVSKNIGDIAGNGPSDNPHTSFDGGRIVFDSAATNLDLDFQVFQGVRQIYTVVDGQTSLLSVFNNGEGGIQPAGGLLEQPRVSADGRTIVFQGFSSSYPGSGSQIGDPATTHVYAAKISSFEFDLPNVLLLDSAGPDQDFASSESGSQASSADISQDGRYAVFVSTSQQIVDNATITGFGDVFRKDLQTGDIELVSSNAQGDAGDSPNGGSFSPSISGDGRLVAFISSSTNLVAQDTNSAIDVFVKDMETGIVARVNTNGGNISSGGDYFTVRLSGDGRYLVYDSANDLLDIPNGFSGSRDIHIKQLAVPLQPGNDMGPLQRLNRGLGGDGQVTNGDSFEPEPSFDGATISFVSNASNLVADDTNGADDVFTVPNPFFTATMLDSDGDSLTNAEEGAMGTNPFRTDTDEDLISDGDEGQLGTSPLNPDSDNDDIGDGTEVATGSDPLMPQTNRLYVSATGSGDQSGSDWSNTLVGNGLVGQLLQSGATPADASYVLYQAGDNVGPGAVFGFSNVVLLGGVADGQPTPGDHPGSYTRFDGDSDGDGAADGTALLIDSADNVQIRNIRMTNGLGFSMDAGGLTVNFPFGAGPLPTVRLINSEVVDNVGTGVAISGTGQLDVVDSRIANNDSSQSGGSGGGINLSFGGPVLRVESSVIANNRSGFNGGGINLENDAIAVVTNSIIIHNSAPSSGGGVYVSEQSNFTGANNLFLGNAAVDAGATSGNNFGGGIGTQAFGSADPASITLSHSTVVFNQALTAGGGFASVNFSGDAALLTFTDNIFYFNDNLDVTNPTFSDEFVNDGLETNISFNDIQSSSDNPAIGTGAPVFDFDPMFTPALRLADNSLAVDAGSQTAAGSAVDGLSTRSDGAPDTSTVDLGFHFDRTPVAVNQAFNLNDSIVAPQGETATLEFTGFTTNFCEISTDPLPGRVVGVRLVAANSFSGAQLRSLTTIDPLLVGGVMATDNGGGVYRVQVDADARPTSGPVQLEVFFDTLSPPMLIEYSDVQLQ